MCLGVFHARLARSHAQYRMSCRACTKCKHRDAGKCFCVPVPARLLPEHKRGQAHTQPGHARQHTQVIECSDAAHGLRGHIISDGGITCPGDVAKAIGGGADFVMMGGVCGCVHRGLPLELVNNRKYKKGKKQLIKPDIQANFWNGDPDIDAVCRMIFKPECNFKKNLFPFFSKKISPFNSQNTLITRKVIKDYFLFPHIGRMDDIWASFYVTSKKYRVLYNEPTVYQQRNVHNLIKDFKDEYIGYVNSLKLVESLYKNSENIYNFLPKKSSSAFDEWKKLTE